jgi:hypothetical protein
MGVATSCSAFCCVLPACASANLGDVIHDNVTLAAQNCKYHAEPSDMH